MSALHDDDPIARYLDDPPCACGEVGCRHCAPCPACDGGGSVGDGYIVCAACNGSGVEPVRVVIDEPMSEWGDVDAKPARRVA